ncbi:MAG: GNAT family N-acetyltransferase [Alphaproteobacteria bacterium]|jgi:GNAT superfamily N-acetyltransferase
MSQIKVTPAQADDKAQWLPLFEGYREFYRQPADPAVAERVWDWIMDPVHPTRCLLARDASGTVFGLAHYRELPRPLSGTVAGFLDDLFVVPEARGSGVAEALIEAVAAEGAERGWSWLRWFTAEDNYRARGFYDRIAALTPWKTYQRDIGL